MTWLWELRSPDSALTAGMVVGQEYNMTGKISFSLIGGKDVRNQ
jgi:hypothetical protein